MNVKEISVQCVNNCGVLQVVIKADGKEVGSFSKKELNAGGVMAFQLARGNRDFYEVPLYENEDGTSAALIDGFKATGEDEIGVFLSEIEVMRQIEKVKDFQAMSTADILDMADYCCELKRRIIKGVQNIRNEKFIKAIHSDYFAKSQF